MFCSKGFFTNVYSLGAFRIALAILLIFELLDRIALFEGFYSNEGIWPSKLMQNESSEFHATVCIHCWKDGSLFWPTFFFQFLIAIALLFGFKSRLAALLSWIFYNSLTLRNVWLSYITDRYFHILLLYALLMPCGRRFSIDSTIAFRSTRVKNKPINSFIIALYKLQVLWIYFDAGYGKFSDPLRGEPRKLIETFLSVKHSIQFLLSRMEH